jgi:hypothetical protein
MSIDSIGGGSSAYDRQTFGAQVVSATLDTMNNQGPGNSFAITDKESFGAAVVGKTLDYMNAGSSPSSDMAQTYDFNKSVLGGHAASLGAIYDVNI